MDYSYEYIDELVRKMQERLTPHRFIHSLGVAYMSASLAMVYGVDRTSATIAGLLHDCAKEIKGDELIKLCERDGVALRPIEYRAKSLIHARYGAYLVKNEFGIEDEDIINAVDNHTVGRAGMSRLEQIVFAADFLEPGRDYNCNPSLDELRTLIFSDIDKACLLILENQISYFTDKPRDIDEKTMETLEYYRNVINTR